MQKSCLIVLLCVAVAASESRAAKSTGVPRFDTAVRSAIAYLKANEAKIVERETSLIAYALLKAGEPPSSPLIQAGVKAAIERAEKGHGSLGYEHIYLAGVDSMLLADVDSDLHREHIQSIVDYVQSAQMANGSWAGDSQAGDSSMAQYGMLTIWAANRAGCTVSPQTVERALQWHLKFGNSDGGWGYRPPLTTGSGAGSSTHNCSMAAAGSLGIGRLLLYGPKNAVKKKAPEKKYGVLEKDEPVEMQGKVGSAFPNHKPQIAQGTLDNRIDRALGWAKTRFHPQGHAMNQKQYFFYALERAAALQDMGPINGTDWFLAYGDVLRGLQSADGGFEKTNSSPRIGACFAILYFMRSTKQIIDKQFGTGIQSGNRGLENLFGGKEKKKKEIGPLDELLGALENANLEELDNLNTDDIVQKVQFGSKEELIGQVDKLKVLMKSPKFEHRQAAYFALGRTGDFSLVPEMLQGLRDVNLDVNVEALKALRYIARKPNGFGISIEPLAGGRITSEEQKLLRANNWRTKAYKTWGDWYRRVRPYEDGGGLDELELLAPTAAAR